MYEQNFHQSFRGGLLEENRLSDSGLKKGVTPQNCVKVCTKFSLKINVTMLPSYIRDCQSSMDIENFENSMVMILNWRSDVTYVVM